MAKKAEDQKLWVAWLMKSDGRPMPTADDGAFVGEEWLARKKVAQWLRSIHQDGVDTTDVRGYICPIDFEKVVSGTLPAPNVHWTDDEEF